MEEWVGGIWDRWVRRAAYRGHPAARVRLDEVSGMLAPLYRAFGGAGAAQIKASDKEAHGARRRWLERVAGIGEQTCHGWADDDALYLPPGLDAMPEAALNRELYIWLTALAAQAPVGGEWLSRSRRATASVLARLPGLASRYYRLVDAHLGSRPDPTRLPADEAAWERAIRAALLRPEIEQAPPPPARWPPHPVPLWLHPDPPTTAALAPRADAADADGDKGELMRQDEADRVRRSAERVELPENRNGMLMVFRAESIFSWAEYLEVNRPLDDDEDPDPRAADDLDKLSIARGGRAPKKRLRFDLDLPPESDDDRPIGAGILYPEWNWKTGAYLPDYCRIEPMQADEAPPCALPESLAPLARRLRRQFELLQPVRVRLNAQQDGDELDLDAVVRFAAERATGHIGDSGLYRRHSGGARSLATLVLADLSLSTDTWVGNEARVVDVIRDALMVFAEALAASRDRFGVYGFSSVRREHVRFHVLKDFGEAWNEAARGRVAAIKPGFYTRMGAAIRHATRILAEQPAERRLLLLLTDGKPNDLDRYEGRHGIEDTRVAVAEARARGLLPFCVTIDRDAGEYLPYLFGSHGFVVARDAAELPRLLPRLYLRLAAPA
ncbi:VWA domain-containing protein [Microvirgula curvata]